MAVEDFKVYTQDSGWVSLAQTLPQGTSEGQLLHWDGTQWAAASDGTADGQYLIWDDTAKRWEPGTHETGNLPIQSDDGTVVLDSPSADTFTVSTGGDERVRVEDTKATFNGQIRNLTASSTVAYLESSTGSSAIKLNSTDQNWWFGPNQFGFCIYDDSLDQKKFVFDAAGNFIVNNGQVQTPTVKGLVDTDAQINLGSNFSVSTGGAERVKVDGEGKVGVCSSSKGIGTINSGLKVSTDKSIGFQNIVYAKDSNAYGFFVGVNLDTPVASQFIAYQSSQPLNYAGDGAYVTKYIDFHSTNTTDFVKEQYGFYSAVASRNDTNGNPLVRYQFYGETSAPSRFNGQVQTPTVKGVVDTDAQIDLGGDLTLDNKSGTIWLGNATNAPAGNTNLFVGSSDGDGKNLLIGSGQPKTAAEAGSSISFATVAGNGDRPRKTRMFISPDGNVGINNTSPDERLVVGGSIRANRIKGFATNPQLIFESSDAQIKTHDDLSYTPTQPNSIATKQTVDDKIQVMTTAEYNALGADVNPTTLYCLTD